MVERTAPGARRQAERLGRRAEWLCGLALWLKGWRILERRLRLPAGEIDILAERRGVLAVVEVKARPTVADALAAVGRRSWQRRQRAVLQYRAARPRLSRHGIRFDLMVVMPGRWPVHLPDVWREEG